MPLYREQGVVLRTQKLGEADRIVTLLTQGRGLLRAMATAGWAPGFDECVRCGAPGPHSLAVVQLGGVVCEDCKVPGAPRLDAGSVTLLAALLAGDWETAAGASQRERNEAAGIAAAYVQWHLERGLRSLGTR